MPDQLTQYYDYLKKAGADVPPTFESFKSTLSDEPSAKQYYDYLKSNKFDAPDTFDSFANTLGLKKKNLRYRLLQYLVSHQAFLPHLHHNYHRYSKT